METNHKQIYSCPPEQSCMVEEPVIDMGWPDAQELFEQHYNPKETVEDAITLNEFEQYLHDAIDQWYEEKENRIIA